jgi:hypothetical protein
MLESTHFAIGAEHDIKEDTYLLNNEELAKEREQCAYVDIKTP